MPKQVQMEFKGFVLNNVDSDFHHLANPLIISPAPFNKEDVTQTAIRLMEQGQASEWKVLDENATDPSDIPWCSSDAEFDEAKQTETTATEESSILVPDCLQNMSLIQALNAMVEKPELRYVCALYYIQPVNTVICTHTLYMFVLYFCISIHIYIYMYIYTIYKLFPIQTLYVYTFIYIYISVF